MFSSVIPHRVIVRTRSRCARCAQRQRGSNARCHRPKQTANAVSSNEAIHDDSCGAHTEIRAASVGLRTVPSTVHCSCARALREGSKLATEITRDSSFVRTHFREITHPLRRRRCRSHIAAECFHCVVWSVSLPFSFPISAHLPLRLSSGSLRPSSRRGPVWPLVWLLARFCAVPWRCAPRVLPPRHVSVRHVALIVH